MGDNQQAIVLFYKYFSSLPSEAGAESAIQQWWKDPKGNVRNLYQWHEANLVTQSLSLSEGRASTSRKRRLPLVGRILIAPEGVNGTLSGNCDDVEAYVELIKNYNNISCTNDGEGCVDDENDSKEEANQRLSDNESDVDMRIFRDVDYKLSYDSSSKPLFPDLKISIVKEIVSTSGLVDVHAVPIETGKHLSPEEFHEILEASRLSKSPQEDLTKEIALIDVRNTFEHEIGYFVDPKTNTKAIDPETTTFSSFDKFCERNAENLRNKKVMMYCTGGIRCEKASILLKRRGVEDVNQLSGGIHRYLEKYGKNGHFKGLNFTFDKRVAMKPDFAFERNENKNHSCRNEKQKEANDTKDGDSYKVVGRCVECNDHFDELCGSRVCTVCRDLVLVCDSCRSNDSLREYHCKRHSSWKTAYFSFLEIFDGEELEGQRSALLALRNDPSIAKNVRRTLTRQIRKVEARMKGIQDGNLTVDKNAPRRCRSCQEPLGEKCDGKCWGFWRKADGISDLANSVSVSETNLGKDSTINGHEFTTPGSGKVMGGRRAKQKREAEMEFLTQPTNGAITCE